MRRKTRGNGTGTAFKRGSTWTAQVVIGWKVVAEDKPLVAITRSKGGFKTRDQALRYCQTLKEGPQRPQEAPTLEQYWNTYKDGKYTKLSPSKQTAYRIAWKKLADISKFRIDQLTVADLQQVVDEKSTSFYTARDMKTVLGKLFTIAAAEGRVSKDIPTFITLPSLDEKEKIPFSETEQASLWKLYESGDLRAAIPLLMIYTGMMPGEAYRLKVSQIDLENRTITGAGMKTKVRRETPVVFPDLLIPVLQDLIANARPSGYIFKRVEDEWYENYYTALELAGCRRLTPYSCRHTTSTALVIVEGIAPQTIKRIMRWSTTRMLDRYTHPSQDDALRAINTLKRAK